MMSSPQYRGRCFYTHVFSCFPSMNITQHFPSRQVHKSNCFFSVVIATRFDAWSPLSFLSSLQIFRGLGASPSAIRNKVIVLSARRQSCSSSGGSERRPGHEDHRVFDVSMAHLSLHVHPSFSYTHQSTHPHLYSHHRIHHTPFPLNPFCGANFSIFGSSSIFQSCLRRRDRAKEKEDIFNYLCYQTMDG